MEDWNGIARSIGFADEKDMWERFYLEEELPISVIAKRLKKGSATVSSRLALCHIDKRTRGGANNMAKVSKILFRVDQRIIFSKSNHELSTMFGVHESTVYKYRRSVTSGRKLTWSSVPSLPSQDLNDTERR